MIQVEGSLQHRRHESRLLLKGYAWIWYSQHVNR